MEKDKIEVGEYIRTRKGLIFKVDKQFKNIQINEFQNLAGERDIVKHSKNIIDLIEVGDYVNGNRVIAINCNFEYIDDDSDTGVAETNEGVQTTGENIINDEFIKTIVTKEQFKEMEYRV